MSLRVGDYTIKLKNNPCIKSTGTVVSPKEGNGPLGYNFDEITTDNLLGTNSWEQAESEFLYRAINQALTKAKLNAEDMDLFFSGDLLNQTVSSNYAARRLGIPFFGLFGACSTSTEGLSLAAIKVDGHYANNVLVGTSSHNCGAERQYRFPTEYGGQRPPYALWTVTGGGAAIISRSGEGPVITHITPGRVVDLGVIDPYDLGSAMAPAAASTLIQHFQDTGRTPDDFDLLVTGDLGIQGSTMFIELLDQEGYEISSKHYDCGLMIFQSDQDVHGGGSGCACSAVVMFSYIVDQITKGQLNRVLLMATGALHNPKIVQQQESIPGICHGVVLENKDGGKENG